MRLGATRSPTVQRSDTPGPTSTISPASSSPEVWGSPIGKREMPSRRSTSRWFSAHAPTLTLTSPGPGDGSGTSSNRSWSTPPKSWNLTALTAPSRR